MADYTGPLKMKQRLKGLTVGNSSILEKKSTPEEECGLSDVEGQMINSILPKSRYLL